MTSITSKDGTKISYIQTGSGPVLVLVGGALQTKSDQMMQSIAPLLSKFFTVICYDRRGRAESSDTLPYSIEREIEDLDALIKTSGGRARVFGNSSGGNLALLAATKLENISKVAVYEAPYIPESELNGSAAKYISGLKAAIAAKQNGEAVKLFMKRIGVPSPMVALMRLTPMWSGLKALAPTLVYDALFVGDGSVPKEISSLKIPVLLLSGTNERMRNAVKALSAVIPAAKIDTLEGQTHNVKPAVLAPALINFFDDK